MSLAAAVLCAFAFYEMAGRHVVRTVPSRTTGSIISAVVGRRAEQSGSADRRMSGIGRKIAGKEAVVRKVASVVAAIIVPGGIGKIPPQERPAACGSVRPRVLGKGCIPGKRRQRTQCRQDRCDRRWNFSLAHRSEEHT